MALTIMAASALAARLAEPLGVKPLLLTGLTALIGATLLLSRVSVGGSYLGEVLPGMTPFAIRLAFSHTTATIGGTAGVPDTDQGLAGGLLAAVAATTSQGAAKPPDAALVAGLRTAFLAALGFAALGWQQPQRSFASTTASASWPAAKPMRHSARRHSSRLPGSPRRSCCTTAEL